MSNYKLIAKRKAIEKDMHNKLVQMGYNIPKSSGIYIFTRSEVFAYIGQAKDLERRIIDHILNYDQRIDISLKKRGIYDKNTNEGEWCLSYIPCDISELDSMERQYISAYQKNGVALYNITSGGQDAGKTDINARKPSKTYKQGVEYGREQERAKIKQLFEKYLDYSIKGASNKIKERKLQEFAEYLDRELN